MYIYNYIYISYIYEYIPHEQKFERKIRNTRNVVSTRYILFYIYIYLYRYTINILPIFSFDKTLDQSSYHHSIRYHITLYICLHISPSTQDKFGYIISSTGPIKTAHHR